MMGSFDLESGVRKNLSFSSPACCILSAGSVASIHFDRIWDHMIGTVTMTLFQGVIKQWSPLKVGIQTFSAKQSTTVIHWSKLTQYNLNRWKEQSFPFQILPEVWLSVHRARHNLFAKTVGNFACRARPGENGPKQVAMFLVVLDFHVWSVTFFARCCQQSAVEEVSLLYCLILYVYRQEKWKYVTCVDSLPLNHNFKTKCLGPNNYFVLSRILY